MDAPWTRLLPPALSKFVLGRHTLQAIVSNSGWLITDRLVRMVGGLTVGAIVARYLGPHQFGQINYAIAFVALFGAFASFGVDNIVIRDLVKHPDQRTIILRSAFTLKIVGAITTLLMAEVTIFLMYPTDSVAHWLIAILAAGVVFQAFDVIDLFLQSTVRSMSSILARIFAFVTFSCIRLALVYVHADVIAFAWASCGELALAAAGMIVLTRGTARAVPLGFGDPARMRSMVREGWPFLLSGLAIMLYMRIDQLMLRGVKGASDVGLYSAALKLSEIWYVIPVAIMGTVAPLLTVIRGQSIQLYYRRLQTLFTTMTRIAYLVAVPMSLLATPLISLIYGAKFAGAGPILAVHIWTAVFVYLGVATTPWIVNEGFGRLQLYRTILGAITNVLLNLYLIPQFGGIGAAVATLLSQAVAVYLSFAFMKRTRDIFGMMTLALCLRT